MKDNGFLIMFIASLAVTGAAVFMFGEVIKDVQSTNRLDYPDASVSIVNVIAENVTNTTFNHVRISVTATDGVVYLNDTLLILRTEQDEAHLQYRNGTLTRSVSTGFYTQ